MHINQVSNWYLKARWKKVRKTRTDGRTDGQTDGHCHSIIRPFFNRRIKTGAIWQRPRSGRLIMLTGWIWLPGLKCNFVFMIVSFLSHYFRYIKHGSQVFRLYVCASFHFKLEFTGSLIKIHWNKRSSLANLISPSILRNFLCQYQRQISFIGGDQEQTRYNRLVYLNISHMTNHKERFHEC